MGKKRKPGTSDKSSARRLVRGPVKHSDTWYRQFFSFPQQVQDLLQVHLTAPWAKDLDYSTLERVNSSFVSEQLRSSLGDCIWRLKLHGHWAYVYLLLEFQSRPDSGMAVRMLGYTHQLYVDLSKSHAGPEPFTLPLVLPIVLYNGDRRWNAATALQDMIPGRIPEDLLAWQPQMRYGLLDAQRTTLEPGLAEHNRVAALIGLEQASSEEAYVRALRLLLGGLAGDEWQVLRRSLGMWLSQILPNEIVHANVLETLEQDEDPVMLADRMKQWYDQRYERGIQQGLVQGLEKGIEKGIEQGLLAGEARVLERLLQRRFGNMPDWVLSRLNQADAVMLEDLAERLLDAPSLESLFPH